jgi:7-carboxy-7-deazaguanine synthase (Cx14CxxC type)
VGLWLWNLPGLRVAGRRLRDLAGGMTTYSAKEIFLTVQGEGGQAGRAAVFLRFAGCNLWSGREQDRASAVCNFCDTDFVGTDGPGGGKFRSAEALADAVQSMWRGGEGARLVVCTGGEPLLQLDAQLVAALHARGFEIAVETNGTIAAPPGIDWICVSPKSDAPVVQASGQELKLVYPQEKAMPERFEHLSFERFYLQPMDGPDRDANTQAAVAYCLSHPRWRLSVQTHKYIGVP